MEINQTGEGNGTWPPSAASSDGGMRRSLSEWEFRQFLEEFDGNHPNDKSNAPVGNEKESETYLGGVDQNPHREVIAKSVPPLPPPPPPPMYSDEYQAYLKSRLQFECATVAFIRSANAESQTSSATSTSVSGSQRVSAGVRCNPANTQDEDAGSAVDKSRAKGKSSSASETSEGRSSMLYEAEGDTETTQDTNVATENQNKRKLLNRESARRSRRRKHELTAKLETTVAQLADEKADLLKRLSEVMSKSNQEAETNKILRGQAESLRSQVKLMEEVVKKVAGFSSAAANRSSGQKAVTPVPQVHHRESEKQPCMQMSGPEIQIDSSNDQHQQNTHHKKTTTDAVD